MSVIEHIAELPYPDGDDQAAKVFPHERYLESVAAHATQRLTPTEKARARRLLTQFFTLAESNRQHIHYSQHRPFDPSVEPEDGFTGDCSSYATQSFYWVRDRLDEPPFHDPNGLVEYDGWGYTGTLLATNHAHPVSPGHRYLVGDWALCGTFWHTVHTFCCAKSGDALTSEWSSHGSEGGPYRVRLHYRSDVFVVVRPLSLL